MGMFFTVGEQKVRPGVYQRYQNVGGGALAGAVDGIVAVTFRGNWGAVGEVMSLTADEVRGRLGSGGVDSTLAVITEAFTGGAVTVLAVRLGHGGTAGSVTLKDTTVGTAVDAVVLTMKNVGSRKFRYAIRQSLDAADKREFLVIENDQILQKIEYTSGGATEIEDFVLKVNKDSEFVVAQKVPDYTGTNGLALVAESDIAPGTDPTVSNEDYETAFALLEPHVFNTICVDTDEITVHALLSGYINRVYTDGKMSFAVIGEPTSVVFDIRKSHAMAFNQYNVIYVGSGAELATGEKLEGWRAAARIAGMVAAVPSNESMTHRPISGTVRPLELLTNKQYADATNSGMMTFSQSSNGTTWVENGITTLVTTSGENDEGWKKIKRSKVRFEVFTRITNTIAPLIGAIANDSDGQATVMKLAKDVLLAMGGEKKVAPTFEVSLDPANPPQGDSAWFIVAFDDVDTMEKVYLTFNLRYSPNL